MQFVQNMGAQDRFPFDSAVVGLNGTYNIIGIDSFFVNSQCILATDKIITIGKTYVIFGSPTETGIKMFDIILDDVYYHEGIINLIVRDLRSQRIFTLHQSIECREIDCKWVLVDLDYFIDHMNERAIRKYCGNCTETKKKPISDDKPNINDDVLEFEF